MNSLRNYISRVFLFMGEALKAAEHTSKKSETAKVRENVKQYCVGNGLDVGFGGDPIRWNSINMDLPNAYARYSDGVQHLHGDARHLHWFRDNVLDYVYSSHVLEDFEDTSAVLNEWIRVVKPGGNVVLFLPDEQVYRQHCIQKGKPPNAHHIHENFGLDYLKSIIEERSDVNVVHAKFPSHIYSFELVLEKVPSNS